nr:hypothetical protein [Tanacetum cinerariifolium]
MFKKKKANDEAKRIEEEEVAAKAIEDEDAEDEEAAKAKADEIAIRRAKLLAELEAINKKLMNLKNKRKQKTSLRRSDNENMLSLTNLILRY